MLTSIFTKLKIIIKRLIGKVVYSYTYLKNYLPHLHTKITKNNIKSLSFSLLKEWKTSSLILISIITLYYGLGAYVSSNINNKLNPNLKINTSTERYTTVYLIHALKTQIDDTPWTPSLPSIFPASVLDNLPQFQLGSKDATLYIIKKMSALYLDSSLSNASSLLDYPEDIWLFSKSKDDKLSPGSSKQYRKALTEIKNFSKIEVSLYPLSSSNLLYQLHNINSLLNRQQEKLEKHTQEYSTDFLDTKKDNIFYYTQGTLYTLHNYLQGLTKDYQALIVEQDLYDDITTALNLLEKAIKLNPILIQNSPLEDVYGANHLIYLAYYISKTQNIINHISRSIEQTPTKDNQQ